MDIRENIEDTEEVLRSVVVGLMKNYWHVMPAQVTQDTSDGHVATVQPTIKRAVTNPTDGTVTYEDHPVHPDVPIHHLGGGGVTTTHPNKKGDTGAILYASRAIDSWFQSDGSQQPMDDRIHSLADGLFLSGIRSIPKKLQQVAQDSAQIRSDDKKNVVDHHPTTGTHIKSADPSTDAASENFDPFTQAKKFFEHLVHPTNGIAHNATDGDTTHAITNTHDDGPKLSATNGASTIGAHPTNGSEITSTIAHLITAPNASLDKTGNLSNAGNHSVGKNLSVTQALSAASGTIGGFGFSAGGGGAGEGNLAMTGSVAGAVLQTTEGYTVATLPVPTTAMPVPEGFAGPGTRAYVTDASGPAFLQLLAGGGSTFSPAICDGTQWLAG